MICPNCGNETNGKFCPRCGTKMPEAAPAEPIFSSAPNPAVNQVPPAAPQAPAQGYIPNPGYAPNPQAGFAPDPQTGFAPNPQAGFAPEPQPAVPNQGYANVPGYVPAQGYNPGQPVNTGYANPAMVDPGNSPARMAIRKLASSPLYLLAAMLFTAGLVLSAIPYVKQLITFFQYFDYYRSDSDAWATVCTVIGTVLVMLILGIALWGLFFAAIRKNPVQMRTGSLTTIKVFLVLGLIAMILGLLALIALTVYAAAIADGESLNEIRQKFLELLRQYNYTFEETDSMSFKTLLIICGAIGAVVFLVVVIYFAKLIKTVNTVERVIRIGHPDDRVSPFAALICILCGLFDIYPAISYLTKGGDQMLSGLSMLCSAACLLCFGILIFQYRGKMRQLGVYRGVSTPNPNR